ARAHRRHALPVADRALPRRRAAARPSAAAAHPRPHARRPPASGDAKLPAAVHDAAAGVLGRARRAQGAWPRHRRGAAAPRLFPERAPVTGLERGRRRRGWLMLTPALSVLALLTLYPGLWVLWLSLRDEVPIFGVSRFTGLRHYAFLFGDARFLAAAWTTAAFTVASVALEPVLGVLAAVGIAGLSRGRRLALSFLLL